MPRAFDQRQLIVDRNPLQQLEPNIGNLPTIDPEQLLRSMLEGFKLLTGIDSTGIPEFFAWITDEIANILNVENWQEIFQSIIDFFAGLADRAGFLTVLDDVIAFFTALADRVGFLGVLEDVVAFFTSLTDFATWTGALKDIVAFFSGLTDFSTWTGVLLDVIEFFAGLTDLSTWTGVLEDVVAFFAGLTDFASWTGVLEDVVGFFGTITNFSTWSAVLKQVTDFFVTSLNLTAFLDMLEDVVQFFASVTSFPTWTATFKTLIDGLTGITSFSTWVGVFKQVIDFFSTVSAGVRANFLLVLKQVTEAFVGLGNSTVIGTFLTVFTQVVNFFGTISAGVRGAFLTSMKTVVDFFAGIITTFGSLTTWTAGLPSLASGVINELWTLLNGGAEAVGKTINDVLNSIGSFASQLIKDITGNPAALGLGAVASWAADVLTQASDLDALKLINQLPERILGLIPVANITLINPNLMGDGGFDTTATLTAGSGWAWDATQTHTAGTSGSAKVTGNGTTRQLYSNMAINVSTGDTLTVKCWVKSTGTVGASGIVLSIVEFNGATQGTTRTIASRASSAGWIQIGNSEASPYTVGAGVTSIRVRLAVTSAAASGSFVWFDDIEVRKVGLLSGDWMTGILGTVAEDFQKTVDSIISAIAVATTTGNPLTGLQTAFEGIFTTLFGPLINFLPTSLLTNPLLEDAIPGLDGSKINDGEVSADFLPIADIGDALGTALTAGSGGKMSRRNTLNKISATAGGNKFPPSFFVTAAGASGVDQISSDITATTTTGRYTVTYAGYYLIELGFTTNASAPAAGAFNVAPAIFLNGSSTPYKVGSDALGSFGFGAGNWARTSHSTFIAYLSAGNYIEAGYFNFGASNGNFFQGDTAGNSTYFSIAMLNRTAEG